MASLKQTRRKVASAEIAELENEKAKLVNLLIVLVRGNGGTIRIPKSEFLKIDGCVLGSAFDAEKEEQVLTVRRVIAPAIVR